MDRMKSREEGLPIVPGQLWMELDDGSGSIVGETSTIVPLRKDIRKTGDEHDFWIILAVAEDGDIFVGSRWYPLDNDVRIA